MESRKMVVYLLLSYIRQQTFSCTSVNLLKCLWVNTNTTWMINKACWISSSDYHYVLNNSTVRNCWHSQPIHLKTGSPLPDPLFNGTLVSNPGQMTKTINYIPTFLQVSTSVTVLFSFNTTPSSFEGFCPAPAAKEFLSTLDERKKHKLHLNPALLFFSDAPDSQRKTRHHCGQKGLNKPCLYNLGQ